MSGGECPIEGGIEPGFGPVRERFAAHFRRADDRRELGASLAVYREGRLVVDLWGGFADRARQRPWTADTLVNVYSTTKAMTALVLALLADRGRLAYDDPVARHWPEFAGAGKEAALVSHVLSHQVGLPGFDRPTAVEDFYDWNRATAALAAQAPRWAPGTRTSYHAMTFGFLAGEIARRAGGASLGSLLQAEIAGPLGADFHIGLPAALDARVAELCGPLNPPDLSGLVLPPEALAALGNPMVEAERPNQAPWRRAEIPAANGHASARGAARIYAMLAEGGALDGKRFLSAEAIDRMTEIQSTRPDLLLGFPVPWAQGVALNFGGTLGPNPDAFGHSGWGGSFVSADRTARVAIGYVCNQMGPDLVGDQRATALVEAIYGCL